MMRKFLFLLFCLISTNAFSATKDVTPRADNEGNMGTASLTWAAGHFLAMTVAGQSVCLEDGTDCPAGSTGDITAVGDVTSGAAFDGTAGNILQFEGATVDGFEVTLTSADPGADFTVTLPATTGTVALTTSNVATATALAANGSNCSAGSAPLGVDASGASESCTDYEEDLSNSAGLLAALSDETGTGVAVFSTTPTLVTPVLGVATATSINKVAITAPATGSTLTIADGATLTASATATVSGTNTGDQTTVSGNAGTVTFADAAGDTTTFVALGTAATGSLSPTTDAGLTYNATTNDLTASGTIDGGTLTEGGNAIYNSTETPGGELGGTWASPTIDDSVTVTGWVMGASTATTPSADDNDTSLATTAYVQTEINAMGGRSLTASSGSMEADVELYTSTKCVYIEDPVAADDLKSLWINDSANGFTLTKLWAESDQTVTCMLQVDDGTPADVDSVDLVATTTPDTDTSLDGDATMAAGDRLDLDVASVSGTPTWVSICWTGTYDD